MIVMGEPGVGSVGGVRGSCKHHYSPQHCRVLRVVVMIFRAVMTFMAQEGRHCGA